MRKLFTIVFFFHAFILFPQSGKKPSSYHPAYIGTFSSVSVITKDSTIFNDTLTEIANAVYDSVITARVKHITPVHTIEKLPANQLRALSADLVNNIYCYRGEPDFNKIAASRLMDSIAFLYDNRYSAYFINFGNIWSKKQDRNYIAGRTLIITAVVVGFALLVALAVTSDNSGFSVGSFISGADGDSADFNFRGMYCYYLVYDRELKQICYLRGLHFTSDKTDNNPFKPLRVEKQIESLFYLPH